MPAPVHAAPGLVFDRRLGWMDLDRTRSLLFDVYHSASVARRRPLGWIDKPSESMLIVYGLTYAVYAEADPALAVRADSLAQRIFANTSFSAAALR